MLDSPSGPVEVICIPVPLQRAHKALILNRQVDLHAKSVLTIHAPAHNESCKMPSVQARTVNTYDAGVNSQPHSDVATSEQSLRQSQARNAHPTRSVSTKNMRRACQHEDLIGQTVSATATDTRCCKQAIELLPLVGFYAVVCERPLAPARCTRAQCKMCQ